jgi:hypothetical protein
MSYGGLHPQQSGYLLVRESDGDRFCDLGDDFWRALGWSSLAKPATLAHAVCVLFTVFTRLGGSHESY